MFLTRDDFQDSIEWIVAYQEIAGDGEIKMSVAEDYAREIFEDFDLMIDENQEQIIEMIIEDITEKQMSIH